MHLTSFEFEFKHTEILASSEVLRDHSMQALLKTMQPQYKLALVEKLCEDVLGTAAEGGLPLDGCCHGVIADALGVIALPDLQISAKSMTSGEDADGDEGGEGGSQAATSQVCYTFVVAVVHCGNCSAV